MLQLAASMLSCFPPKLCSHILFIVRLPARRGERGEWRRESGREAGVSIATLSREYECSFCNSIISSRSVQGTQGLVFTTNLCSSVAA